MLNFRIDRFGEGGEPLQSLAVEMRGRRISGSVNDGEWVEVPGSWDEDELLQPRRVRNLTTNTLVRAKRASLIGRVFMVILTLIVVVIILIIGTFVIVGIASQLGSAQ